MAVAPEHCYRLRTRSDDFAAMPTKINGRIRQQGSPAITVSAIRHRVGDYTTIDDEAENAEAIADYAEKDSIQRNSSADEAPPKNKKTFKKNRRAIKSRPCSAARLLEELRDENFIFKLGAPEKPAFYVERRNGSVGRGGGRSRCRKPGTPPTSKFPRANSRRFGVRCQVCCSRKRRLSEFEFGPSRTTKNDDHCFSGENKTDDDEKRQSFTNRSGRFWCSILPQKLLPEPENRQTATLAAAKRERWRSGAA